MAVISLQEAKTHLNITGTEVDDEVTAFINAATTAIVSRVGPIESTSANTVRRHGGVRALTVKTGHHLLSVQSVTPVGGTAITASLLFIDTDGGVIEYADGSAFTERAYDIVYTAGWNPVPTDLKQAVLEMTRHLWKTQRGTNRRPGSHEDATPGEAHTLSWRVKELITPYMRVPVA